MSILVSGNFYTGKDAQCYLAQIRCEPDGYIHFDHPTLAPQHISEIEVSDRIGNIPRTLRFTGGQLFETNEHRKFDKWLSSVQKSSNFLHQLESNWRFVLASVVGLAVILFVTIRWGIPAASETIAARLPEQLSATIGSGALEALDDNLFEASTLDVSRRKALTKSFNDALPENKGANQIASKGEVRYQLEFRHGGPLGANAFALPNGTIVVTDELIELARNDQEILSVLLHEMGHVHKRHSLRMLISHSGLAMLSLAILGDVSSAGALVLALPSVLVESSYSRDLESEADDYALARMRDLNIETEHFANLMQRLEKCAWLVGEDFKLEQCEAETEARNKNGPNLIQYMSTHPATEERIAKFRNNN